MIRCPFCDAMFRDDDKVILDIFNTITHLYCFKGGKSTIRDHSTYSTIVNSYSCFRDIKNPAR